MKVVGERLETGCRSVCYEPLVHQDNKFLAASTAHCIASRTDDYIGYDAAHPRRLFLETVAIETSVMSLIEFCMMT